VGAGMDVNGIAFRLGFWRSAKAPALTDWCPPNDCHPERSSESSFRYAWQMLFSGSLSAERNYLFTKLI